MAIKCDVVELDEGCSPEPLQDWLIQHPNITGVRITANGNYVIIVYEETA